MAEVVKVKTPKRMTDADLTAKYPHYIPASLVWDVAANQKARAKCADCGTSASPRICSN